MSSDLTYAALIDTVRLRSFHSRFPSSNLSSLGATGNPIPHSLAEVLSPNGKEIRVSYWLETQRFLSRSTLQRSAALDRFMMSEAPSHVHEINMIRHFLPCRPCIHRETKQLCSEAKPPGDDPSWTCPTSLHSPNSQSKLETDLASPSAGIVAAESQVATKTWTRTEATGGATWNLRKPALPLELLSFAWRYCPAAAVYPFVIYSRPELREIVGTRNSRHVTRSNIPKHERSSPSV
jgi:hypothetical protein